MLADRIMFDLNEIDLNRIETVFYTNLLVFLFESIGFVSITRKSANI